MKNRYRLAPLLPLLVSLALLLAVLLQPLVVYSDERGLLVVTTFPNIAGDIKLLTCSSDSVRYIAPPGIDPHEYQLTVRDVALLQKADVIVSTAHTPFENDIRKLWSENKLHAVLVEIPSIPGIVVRNNPLTGKPNYHMVIYDPYNYLVFMKYLAQVFSSLRPECSSIYRSNLKAITSRLARIILDTPLFSARAVGDTPAIQYAIEWTGIRVEYLVVKEHGVMATPGELRAIESILSRKEAIVVVLDPPVGRPSRILVDLASRHSVQTIFVPSPFSPGSIIDKLESISIQLKNASTTVSSRLGYERVEVMTSSNSLLLHLAGLLSGASLLLLVLTTASRREGRVS